jgi:flagellar hook-basal body complex protein FliE
LGEQASELSQEAGAHGWHGIAERVQEAGEALEAAVGGLDSSQQAAERAAAELELINDKIPAEEVVGHLATSSSELGTATTEVQGALEKVDEAQTAVNEVGQEGMMRAILDLHDQVSEIHKRITEQQAVCEKEQAEADAFAKRQLGN